MLTPNFKAVWTSAGTYPQLKLIALSLLWLILAFPVYSITIDSISFIGLENLDEAALTKASGLSSGQVYEPQTVAEATNRIYAYLQTKGRYFVSVKAPELIPVSEDKLKLEYTLQEVLTSSEVKLKMQGMQNFSEAKLLQLLLLDADKSYPLNQLPRVMQQILSLYNSRGYLFASVQLDSLVKNQGLIAYLKINEGKVMRVKEYIFRGNKTTRDKTLLNLSGLQNVKIINPEVLRQAEENILRKSYIRDCLVEPIDESSLLIRVEEGRMTFMEGVLGLNRVNNELKLSGQLRVQFLNLWGSDRAIKLYWKQLPTSSGELSLSYHESGLAGIPFAADVEINRSVQDSTWIKSKALLQIYYQMLRQNLGLELSTESLRPGSRRPVTISSTRTEGLGGFWNYSRMEGGANPYQGWQANALYRVSKSTDNAHFWGATEAGAKAFIPIGNRFVGYAGLQIRNLENANSPVWQLYQLGGYNSLRGYREDEYASYRVGWTNYELRYRLSPDSRVYLLFDQGFLGMAGDRLKYDLFGLGMGLKIKTQVGILGIEYALGYRDKRLSSIGLGMVHAGLDLAF